MRLSAHTSTVRPLRALVRPGCLAALLLALVSCNNCDDCQPMTSYVFSVVNESDRQLALIFYLDPQLIPAGRERVEVPANSEVRLLDIIASQASGPITFVPAEFGGGRGTYDSLAVETPTGRSVLTPLACDDPRNALCIGNYQRAETRNLIRYTLFLEE